jgi:hypothetical protein
VAFALLVTVCRTIAAICAPLRRLRVPDVWPTRLRAMPTSALAAALLFANLAVLGLLVWRHSELLQGLQNFIQRSPEHLGALSPSNSDEQNGYRRDLSLVVFVFGLAWYRLITVRHERRDRDGALFVAGGLAVCVLSVCLLAAPWRLLRHNSSERVSYLSQACYLVGQRENEGVLFCPQDPPPWNRIVKLDDPALRREHVFGNIFETFGTTH